MVNGGASITITGACSTSRTSTVCTGAENHMSAEDHGEPLEDESQSSVSSASSASTVVAAVVGPDQVRFTSEVERRTENLMLSTMRGNSRMRKPFANGVQDKGHFDTYDGMQNS